jgi:hypothetical protein
MGATIYLDPVGMDATAGAVGEHANQIQTLTSTLESAGSAAVPAALAGWLAEELHGIAVQAQLVALVYTVAALDTALRAQQIQADQSLVAAQPDLATTSVDLGAALAAAGSTIGGSYTSVDIVDPSGASVDLNAVLVRAAEAGIGKPTLANSPFLLASSQPGANPAVVAQLAGLGGLWNEINFEEGRGSTNSRIGVSYSHGVYEGADGRTGTGFAPNPDRPGEYEVH